MSGVSFMPRLGNTPDIGTPVSLANAISTAAARTTFSFTTGTSIPAGALVVVAVQAGFAVAQTISSITDGTNSYSAFVTNAFDASTQLMGAVWYKENAAAVSSGATITATFSGSTIAQPTIVQVAYFTGIALASAIDASNTSTSVNTTTYASGSSGALAQAKETVVGFVGMYNANATITESTGFSNIGTTAQGAGSFFQSRLSYTTVGTTTALNYQPSPSTATYGKCFIATFRGM